MRFHQMIFGLFWVLIATTGWAQSPDVIRQLIERPAMYTDQAILDLIPQLPPAHYQYVFPAFHEMSALSHRLRTMPEIAKWRRKVPTRLAPEVEGQGPYGWRYLSPFLYIYLMPEMWPSYYKENEAPKLEITRQIDWTNADDVRQAFEQFSHVEDLRKSLSARAAIDVEGGVSEQDMRMVHQVFSDLVALSETPEGKAIFSHVVVALDSDKIYPAMARPCASLTERMRAIGMGSFLDPVLAKAQVSEADFVEKCERITRAYRVSQSTPEMALYIIGLKKKLKDNPTASVAPIWRALIEMFSVSMADVQAVYPHRDQWKNLFNRQRPLLLGTPFMVDF